MSEQNTVPPAPQADAVEVDRPPGAGETLPGGRLRRLPGDPLRRLPVLSRIPAGFDRKVLAIAAALVVLLGFLVLRAVLAGDDTAEAKAGDCVASVDPPKDGESGPASAATLVDCGSAQARFTVIGRVEEKTRAEFETDTGELKICMDAGHQDAEYMYWAPRDDGRGYVLCLTRTK